MKNRFTSCSGFISFYSNDIEDIENLLEYDMEHDNVIFESVLNFVLELDEIEDKVIDNYLELLEFNYGE